MPEKSQLDSVLARKKEKRGIFNVSQALVLLLSYIQKKPLYAQNASVPLRDAIILWFFETQFNPSLVSG